MSLPGDRLGESGYSLLEVLIVLVIIGIASSLFSQGFSFARRADLDGLAKMTRALTTTQRVQALALGQPMALKTDALTRDLVGADGATVRVPESVEVRLTGMKLLHADQPAIVFFPDGTVLGGRIRFSEGQEVRTIDVRSVPGGGQYDGP